jgi:PKD domain.
MNRPPGVALPAFHRFPLLRYVPCALVLEATRRCPAAVFRCRRVRLGRWRGRHGDEYSPDRHVQRLPSTPTAGAEVQFDASAAGDEDGMIATYEWQFEADETGTGATVAHTFPESVENTYGEDTRYEVTLTVTDDDGATATASKVVRVTPTSSTVNWTQVVGGRV